MSGLFINIIDFKGIHVFATLGSSLRLHLKLVILIVLFVGFLKKHYESYIGTPDFKYFASLELEHSEPNT